MVILTPENFVAENVVVKKDDKGKIKVLYKVVGADRQEKEEKIEISNGFGIVSPAYVNGFSRENNFTSKEWTGNYKPGFKLLADPKAPTSQELALIEFYDKIYKVVKETMGKNKSVCPNPIFAETLESFVKYPNVREKGKPVAGTSDTSKSPAIWAKCYYSVPEGTDPGKATPEEKIINPLIKNEFNEPVSHTDLENKYFKSYYRLQLFGIENNPNTGGKVFSWRISELKVSVLGDATSGERTSTITASF